MHIIGTILHKLNYRKIVYIYHYSDVNDIFHKVSMTGDHSNSVSFLWDVSVLYLTGKENIGLCGLENSGEFRRDL